MTELQCKTRNGLLMAVMGLTILLVALPNVASADETGDEGFVPLLNGKNLSGWQTTGNWAYESDGVLAVKPGSRRRRLRPDYQSFLWSKAMYDDFVLDLEFKVGKDGSSGVFLRSTSPRRYIQAQIRDSYRKGPLGDRTAGAVVGVKAPRRNMAKPAGEWNRMIITCDRNRMQVELNGEQVIDIDLNDSPETRSIRSGRIGLENANNPVAFRNVRIKELSRK
jgi:hypothetical protein